MSTLSFSSLKKFRLNSILIRNCLYIIILIVVPLTILVTVNYAAYKQEVRAQMQGNNIDVLEKCKSVGDNLLEDIKELAGSISAFPELQYFLEAREIVEANDQKLIKVQELLKQYMDTYTYIDQIYVFSNRHNKILSSYDIRLPWKAYDKWLELYQNLKFDQTYIFAEHDNSAAFVYKPMFNSSTDLTGIVVIQVNMQRLGKILADEFTANRSLYIVDYQGNILYGTGESSSSLATKLSYELVALDSEKTIYFRNDGNWFLSAMESKFCTFRYTLLTNQDFFKEESAKLSNHLAFTIVILVTMSLITACLLTMLTYWPVIKIMRVIQDPYNISKKNNFKKQDELVYITSSILNTIESKEQLGEELQKRIELLNESQVKALQFQMNPHFLANTLELIKWTSVEEFGLGNNTSRMLTKLAALYREALNDDVILVTVDQEVAYLKKYIEMLDFRYSGRIEFEITVNPDSRSQYIPKMILQPLIENAIKYGLKPKQYYGTITVKIEKQQSGLKIMVTNDGEMPSRGKIDSINEKLNQQIMDSVHVGLQNVNSRIKLIYGKGYGMRLSLSESQKELTVNIALPLI